MKFQLSAFSFSAFNPVVKHDAPLSPEEREELALGLEDFTGRPQDAGSAQANLDAMRRRITYLENEKRKLLAAVPGNVEAKFKNGSSILVPITTQSLREELSRLKADLAKARALAAGYEAQIKGKN